MRIPTPKTISLYVLSIFCVAMIVILNVSASEPISAELQNHLDDIKEAQQSQANILPALINAKAVVSKLEDEFNSNNDKAYNARANICKHYKDFCKKDRLDPEKSDVDLSQFLILR